MPLSDKEQQILQEIERHLYEQDPKFAKGVAATTLETHAFRNLRRGILLFASGFAVLVAFFFTQAVVVGVAAFLLMVAGATIAFQNARRLSAEHMRSISPGAGIKKIFGPQVDRLRDLRRGKDN